MFQKERSIIGKLSLKSRDQKWVQDGTILSIAFIGLFAYYLFNFRFGYYLHPALFWFVCISILSLIIYQIIRLDALFRGDWLILLQIMLFVFLIATVFIPPIVPFFGHDAYREYAASIELKKNGWLVLSSGPFEYHSWFSLYPHEIGYPALHLLGLTLSTISGLDLIVVARWIPLVFCLVANLLIYTLALRMGHSKKAALLICLGFSVTYRHLMFHSLYVRETIGFVMFVAAIYSYYTGQVLRKKLFQALAIVFSAVTVLSHHLTSFLLLGFFIFSMILEALLRLLNFITHRKLFIPTDLADSRQRRLRLLIILILLSSMIFIYWMFLPFSPFRITSYLIKDMVSSKIVTARKVSETLGEIASLSLRYRIMLLGYGLLSLAFGSLAIFGLFRNRRDGSFLQLPLVAWGALMGMLAGGIGFGLILRSERVSFAGRFEGFGYFALFLASGYAVTEILNIKRLTVLLALLFITYALFTLYRIPPYLYSNTKTALLQKYKVRNLLSEGEYRAVLWPEDGSKIAADSWLRPFFWPIRNVAAEKCEILFEQNFKNIEKYEYITLSRRRLKKIASAESYVAFNSITCLDRVYDSGAAEIYSLKSSVDSY